MTILRLHATHGSQAEQEDYLRNVIATHEDPRAVAFAKLALEIMPKVSTWIEDVGERGGTTVNDMLSMAASISASICYTVVANAVTVDEVHDANEVVIDRFSDFVRAGVVQ